MSPLVSFSILTALVSRLTDLVIRFHALAAIELGTKVGKLQLRHFADGEESVLVAENVRGKDVYVIQPTGFPVHHNLIQLLLIISALRGCSANHVTAVIPYFGYKRDVGGPSSPFSARMFAMQRQQEHEASPETDILYDPMTPSQLRRALREMELSQVGVPLRPGMTEDEMNQAMEEKEPPMCVAQSICRVVIPFFRLFFDLAWAWACSLATRVPISAAEVARMIEAMGVDAVISVDLQPPGHGQIEVRCCLSWESFVGRFCYSLLHSGFFLCFRLFPARDSLVLVFLWKTCGVLVSVRSSWRGARSIAPWWWPLRRL